MRDKNDTDKNWLTEFSSIFVCDPKIKQTSADRSDYDKIHLAPLEDLFDDNDENDHEK